MLITRDGFYLIDRKFYFRKVQLRFHYKNAYQVRKKDYYMLSDVPKLLREFIPRLSHEADDLIFQQRYIIPDECEMWVLKTIHESWRVHKSRIKKAHYKAYKTDEDRLENSWFI